MKLAILAAGICIIASPIPAEAQRRPEFPIAAKTAAAKTGKERLGDKASDEQRVNDCRVPPEQRGASRRPAECAPQ